MPAIRLFPNISVHSTLETQTMKLTRKTGLALAALAALTLTACGGDGDDAPPPAPAPVPQPAPTPTPPAPTPTPPAPAPARDRIEPFDLPAGKNSAEPARSRLPAQAAVAQINLGALAQAKSDTVLNQTSGPGVPVQIGLSRAVQASASADNLAALLNWTPTPQGTQIAAVRFTSAQAHGVRLGLKIERLPEGAQLRFYGDASDEVQEISASQVLELLALNRQADGASASQTYWSPDFGGETTTLEIELPAGASAADVQLAVPTLIHNVIDPARVHDFQLKGIGDSGSCNLNVTCNSALLNTESRAEAQMVYVKADGESYVCSGTLMNDARNSRIPYFLTANHCLSTQSEASTLQTRWFFRAASCGSATSLYSGSQRLTRGARMLYASASTDTAFMQLNEAPPAGVRYAGSYFGGVVPLEAAVTGVHHPKGDLQKYSRGGVRSYTRLQHTSQGTLMLEDSTPQNFLTVQWLEGTTEGGSSGSGLFASTENGQKRYLVGQLFGGDASCANRRGGDAYGRFDLAYNAALKRWLNP